MWALPNTSDGGGVSVVSLRHGPRVKRLFQSHIWTRGVYVKRRRLAFSFSSNLRLDIFSRAQDGKERLWLQDQSCWKLERFLFRRSPGIKMLSLPDEHTGAVLDFGSAQRRRCLSKVNNFFALRGFFLPYFLEKGNDNYQHEWTWPPPFISCV